jgi:uncharacterized membrane protein YqaE (UPF0057 family)
MGKVLLIILCLFFPFIAVLIHDGPCMKVLWAFLLQLLGHIPGVIYGIYQVTRDWAAFRVTAARLLRFRVTLPVARAARA